MKKISFKLMTVISVICSFVFVQSVHAEEIVISGNSSDSDNTVTIAVNQNNTVEQNNTVHIENTIQSDANTGDNTASDNSSSNTHIDTGNTTQEIAIENNTNINHVDNTCCQTATMTLNITNNGNQTSNTIDFQTNTQTSVAVNNTAHIVNSIAGNVNTGGNIANNNTGDVYIETGNIYVKEYVSNHANKNYVKVPTGGLADVTLFIQDNARDSVNTIAVNDTTIIAINTNNFSDIVNESFWDLVTGGNTASDNTGDVAIKTGDIYQETVIKNQVNTNETIIDCCKEPETPVRPEEPKTPPPPVITVINPIGGSSGNNGGSSGGTTGGSVLAAAIGQVLPATGSNWLFYALFGNVMMFLLGAILRLRSGRAPAYVYA
jgi:hypothetical protein